MWRSVLPILIVVFPAAELSDSSDYQPLTPVEFKRIVDYGLGWESIRVLGPLQARVLGRGDGYTFGAANLETLLKADSQSYSDNSQVNVPRFLPLVALESLTANQARNLAGFAGHGILLWSLSSLDSDAALELAGYRGDWVNAELDLSGLTELGGENARALAGFRGSRLKLNGLGELSPEAAAYLSAFRGQELHLNAIRAISHESLRALAGFTGELISLNGLTGLPTLHARALAKFRGSELRLAGIRELDDSETEELVRFKGSALDLSGVTYLSDEQCVILSRAEWRTLNLNGLTALTPVQARALARYAGEELLLNSLRDVNDTSLWELARFSGRRLELGGLKTVSDEQLMALATFAGNDLYLGSLASVGDKAVDILLRRSRADLIWLNSRAYVSEERFKMMGESGRIGLIFSDLEALSRAPLRYVLEWRGGLALGADARLTDLQLEALTNWPGHTLDLAGLRALGPNQANLLSKALCMELRLGGLHMIDEKDIETLAHSPIPQLDISRWSRQAQVSYMQFKYDLEMGMK